MTDNNFSCNNFSLIKTRFTTLSIIFYLSEIRIFSALKFQKYSLSAVIFTIALGFKSVGMNA